MSTPRTPSSRSSPSNARWLALGCLACAFGAPLVYFLSLSNPTARSTGWPLWVVSTIGLALGALALARGGRSLARIAFGISVAATSLFVFVFAVVLRLPKHGAPNVGDSLPALVLPDERNQPVALADLWREGPLLLVLYRGSW